MVQARATTGSTDRPATATSEIGNASHLFIPSGFGFALSRTGEEVLIKKPAGLLTMTGISYPKPKK